MEPYTRFSHSPIALLVLSSFLFAACKSIDPLPPQDLIIEPTIPKPKPSTINIPIELNLIVISKKQINLSPKNLVVERMPAKD